MGNGGLEKTHGGRRWAKYWPEGGRESFPSGRVISSTVKKAMIFVVQGRGLTPALGLGAMAVNVPLQQ